MDSRVTVNENQVRSCQDSLGSLRGLLEEMVLHFEGEKQGGVSGGYRPVLCLRECRRQAEMIRGLLKGGLVSKAVEMREQAGKEEPVPF